MKIIKGKITMEMVLKFHLICIQNLHLLQLKTL